MRTKLGKMVVCLSVGMMLGGVSAMAGRFTDNSNDTVTDTTTGLVWQQKGDTEKNWIGALAYCEGLANFAGKSDWRLPNIRELLSIVDYTKFSPAIDRAKFLNTDFSDTIPFGYWSSTSYEDWKKGAWYVNFRDGTAAITGGNKTGNRYVRCVRGGELK